MFHSIRKAAMFFVLLLSFHSAIGVADVPGDSAVDCAQPPSNQQADSRSCEPPPASSLEKSTAATGEAISGNPGAVNVKVGLGLASKLTRLDKLGIFIGGLWVGNGD